VEGYLQWFAVPLAETAYLTPEFHFEDPEKFSASRLSMREKLSVPAAHSRADARVPASPRSRATQNDSDSEFHSGKRERNFSQPACLVAGDAGNS